MTNRAPLILASVLLLLPVLYVGSYFAVVEPEGDAFFMLDGTRATGYRFGSGHLSRLFWPLEQIDRKLRPDSWHTNSLQWQPGDIE